MDSMKAMMMGMASRGNPLKVFDWNKAAQLIRDRKPNVASAGLSQDWEYTGGSIYQNGRPLTKDETYTYLASNWATPELGMDGDVIPCFIMEGDVPQSWGDDYAKVFWPDSAVAILNGQDEPILLTNGE